MTLRFLPALGALLGIACASDPTGPASGSSEYFPLDVGNRWTYVSELSDSSIHTFRVIGTQSHAGYTYATLVWEHPRQLEPDTLYYRADANGRLYWRQSGISEGSSDLLMLDPLMEEGEKIDWTRTTAKDSTDTVPAGVFDGCIEVAHEGMEASGETYAPGVGPIRRWWFKGFIVLREAVIRGRKIP
jgi:hypothetical protein